MPRLLGLHVKNYRALAAVAVLFEDWRSAGTQGPVALIGPNGAGKSTFLDTIGFLSDVLIDGAEAACDAEHRGGFSQIVRQGASQVQIGMLFTPHLHDPPLFYSVDIRLERSAPTIVKELLSLRDTNHVQALQRDARSARISKHTLEGQQAEIEEVTLTDPTRLAISSLGQLAEHPQIAALRDYLNRWYLCYFQPDAARSLPVAGPQRRLNRTGSNLGNYIQYLDRNHPVELKQALLSATRKIPGLQSIDYKRTEDGRLLLSFNERGYKDPFYQMSMSDGTLKILAYLLLLADPEPPALIGIEEPENGLYPRLQTLLAEELREACESGKTQVILATHSPYLVNAFTPEQVFLMGKNAEGEATITRTADIPTIQALYDEGIPIGNLWYSNHFGEWTGE